MQNEFERQVQLKMEELKLVPSEPVWQKVELQIQRKKDRRRVIFWIPLFALVGAGLWLGIDQYSQTTAYKAPAPANENPVILPSTRNDAPAQDLQTRVTDRGASKETLERDEIKSNGFSPLDVKRTPSEELKTQGRVPDKEKVSLPANEPSSVAGTEAIKDKSEPVLEKQMPMTLQPKVIEGADTSTATKSVPSVSNSSQPVRQDSQSVIAVPIKKYAVSRSWKFNVVAFAGSSGLGRVEFYNGQKSMNVYNSPPPGTSSGGSNQYSSYGPSTVEKGLAFSVGANGKRAISHRMFFSTGLHYDYYSNTIQVGSQVNQNRTFLNYPVSQFYLGQGSSQYSQGQVVIQPYKNHYHFVSVPLDMDWQVFKKRPLNLSFGFAFQYLVGSNALRYDYANQSYFHNINAFNRTQLMSGLSLTYSVPLGRKPLSLGPQFQYGLTCLEKGNADNHLFSYGLKAQWQFKN